MIDFTKCEEVINNYKGSEKKKTLIYEGKKYLVKFPDPVREKNKSISYINNAFSEYVGSNIFKSVGFETQNTILGKYIYKGKEKIVCACEDFTTSNLELYEFENIVLSVGLDKKIDTELDDIIKTIHESSGLIPNDTMDKFYEMFIIDALIGNTDRHNGNWGFLINKSKNNEVIFAPIYDCGSALNPMLDDEEISNMSSVDKKNIIVNTYSCLKINNKRINYLSYIKRKENKKLNEALIRIFPNINIVKIINFIENIEILSSERKRFYIDIIKGRYEIIKEVYEELKS